MPLPRQLFCLLLLFITVNLTAQDIPAADTQTIKTIKKPHIDAARLLINGRFGRGNESQDYNQVPLNHLSYRIESGPLDTCATHTYRLKIGNDNANDEVTQIILLSGGGMVVTGKTDKNNSQDDALLIKLDESGDIIWSRSEERR